MSFFVSTDGEENKSKRFSTAQVKQQIIRLTQEEKWDFIFAGANIDAFTAGQSYGIQPVNIANIKNDGLGQKAVYKAVAIRQKANNEVYRAKAKVRFECEDDAF